jgi:pectate lyase
MLIGSSDSATADIGKLRVTLHHNMFVNVIQRMPRVRFGQVHLFNNYYDLATTDGYGYSWGVGIQSQIYAQNNFFYAGAVMPDKFISQLNGTMIFAIGTFVYGEARPVQTDVVSAYNATHNPDLAPKVAWTPVLFNEIDPGDAVPGLVAHNAGVFHGPF